MSTIDWVMAQGLGRQQIDGELYRLRASHEEPLRTAQGKLQEQCAKAEALRVELEADLDIPADTPVIVEDVLAKAATTLPGKFKALQRAEQTQEAYRLRHGLTREPAEPDTAKNLLFLMILVFVEAGINASFFQNAYMVASPVAALLTSVLFSIANIVVSVCAGYSIGRWKTFGANAADSDAPEFTARRNQAKWQFRGFLGVMIFLHATVGLIRSLESLDTVHHTLANYAGLFTTPEAFFLVLTGACMSVLAYQKGVYAFGDPYPEYGDHHRRVMAANDELLDLFDDFLQQIEKRFDCTIDVIDTSSKAKNKGIKKYNQVVKACVDARHDLGHAVGKAESEVRMQIAQMVNHHRGARGRRTPIAESALGHLVSFQSFLNCDLPAYLPTPETSPRKAQLVEAKSDALKRLNAILQRTYESNSGEPE